MIIALIPARGGSVRIPRKNLQRVGGQTLIRRAVRCAREARNIERVLVCTEDEEIASEARDSHALVCSRPIELAAGYMPMESVIHHFIFAQGLTDADVIVLLEPPATFRRPNDLDAAIAYLHAHPEASGVRTVTRVERPPYFLHTVVKGFLRPLLPSVYNSRWGNRPMLWRDNGVANVFRVRDFNKDGELMNASVLAMEIAEEARGLDIDFPDDLVLAHALAGELDRD